MPKEGKPPFILEPKDPASGRPAVVIYLHGLGDDGEGLPLGLAQQFQMYNRAGYVRWILPNAPDNSWYTPRSLPNIPTPLEPGQVYAPDEEDDEKGILETVEVLDKLVDEQLANGIPPDRILVGGFSQGCAISLVWSVVGRNRYKVAGVMPMCGYFPLGHKLEAIRKERGIEDEAEDTRKWYCVHGEDDQLVSPKHFAIELEILAKWVGKDKIDPALKEGMGHSTNNSVLRGMLRFFNDVIPP